MAFSRAALRGGLTSSRPLCRQARHFFQGRSNGGFGHLGGSAAAIDVKMQQPSEIKACVPVMNGSAVSFPLVEKCHPSEGLSVESIFSAPTAIGSAAAPKEPLDCDTSSYIEDDCEELLKSFEVPGSMEVATRLFQGIEVRAELFRRSAAEQAASRESKPPRPVPALSDLMLARFGSADNIAALVCRFARVSYDIAGTEDRSQKTAIVRSAVQELLGSPRLARSEIDAIVDAVSAGQHQKLCQETTYAACGVIRFLSFANVWQKLSVEQRHLIVNGPAGWHDDKMATDGLVDGLKAFEKSWDSLSAKDQSRAKANLGGISQQHLVHLRIAQASAALPALHHV